MPARRRRGAGEAIERGVARLKDFLAAEMRATHTGDTQACRGPRPSRDPRGPAVRGLQSELGLALPGLDAGRIDDAPLQPTRQVPARP